MTAIGATLAFIAILIVILWPLRTWLTAAMGTRLGRSFAVAAVFALALQSAVALIAVPDRPAQTALNGQTFDLKQRTAMLEKRLAAQKTAIKELGAPNNLSAADAAGRKQGVDAEQAALTHDIHQLADDTKAHLVSQGELARSTDGQMSWSLLAALAGFALVFAVSYMRSARPNQS